MDPITIILTALVTGAAAGLKPTAEQVVKDAYSGFKTFIKSKYTRVSVDNLEADPASEARKRVVREDLEKANAGNDAELLLQAKAVLDAVREHAPAAAREVGVDIADLKAQSLRVVNIIVQTGTGVSIRDTEVSGPVDVSDVRVGGGSSKARRRQ
jgi:hypothetical protein